MPELQDIEGEERRTVEYLLPSFGDTKFATTKGLGGGLVPAAREYITVGFEFILLPVLDENGRKAARRRNQNVDRGHHFLAACF